MRIHWTAGVGLLVLAAQAAAQTCTGSWTNEFRPQYVDHSPGDYSQVSSAVVFDDDGPGPHLPALYIGGNFSSAGGNAAAPCSVMRWEGSGWVPVNTGATNPTGLGTTAMAVFDDDGAGPDLPALYVSSTQDLRRFDGHSWTVVKSSTIGTEGLYFSKGEIFGYPNHLFVIDDDGPGPDPARLYASVSKFTGWPGGGEYDGLLYRLDPSGWTLLLNGGLVSNAAYFDPGPGNGQAGVYVSHMMDSYDTQFGLYQSWSLSVLNSGGQTDVLSSYDDATNSLDASAVFDDDGPGPHLPALYIAGVYPLTAGGPSTPHIGRYDGHQLITLPYGPDVGANFLQSVDSDPTNGGHPSLYVSGQFTSIGGISASGMARWNGSSWSALSTGLTGGYSPLASILLPFDFDGSGLAPTKLFAGGSFTQAGYAPSTNAAVWDGQYWLAPGNVVSNPVHALLNADLGAGTALYLGGEFVRVGGVPVSGIARWDGAAWDPMGPGFDNHVDALAIYNDGSPHLVAAGKFDSVGGVPVNHIAIWRTDHWEPLGAGIGGDVSSLLAIGSTLYAGGTFTGIPGAPQAAHLAAWDGTAWHAVGTFDNDVNALAQFQGHLYAGGAFNSITNTDGSTIGVARIAGFDGSHWFSPVYGVNFFVSALATYDDGTGAALYVGGGFDTASGTPASRLARWDGAQWSAVDGGVSGPAQPTSVSSLAVIDDGGTHNALYVGGNFTQAGAIVASRIARWDGHNWTALGAGTADTVRAIASFRGVSGQDRIYAGGDFLSAGGAPSWYLASWSYCPPTCYANCDNSTTPPILNVNDFQCFLNKFASGDPYANCDNSTAPPTLNANDFQCFLNAFSAGCP